LVPERKFQDWKIIEKVVEKINSHFILPKKFCCPSPHKPNTQAEKISDELMLQMALLPLSANS